MELRAGFRWISKGPEPGRRPHTAISAPSRGRPPAPDPKLPTSCDRKVVPPSMESPSTTCCADQTPRPEEPSGGGGGGSRKTSSSPAGPRRANKRDGLERTTRKAPEPVATPAAEITASLTPKATPTTATATTTTTMTSANPSTKLAASPPVTRTRPPNEGEHPQRQAAAAAAVATADGATQHAIAPIIPVTPNDRTTHTQTSPAKVTPTTTTTTTTTTTAPATAAPETSRQTTAKQTEQPDHNRLSNSNFLRDHTQLDRRAQSSCSPPPPPPPPHRFTRCRLPVAVTLACLITLAEAQFLAPQADDGTNEVVFVDLRVKENSVQHHTILYEQIDHVNPLNPTGPSMVLRRGEFLNIVIHLRAPYNKQTDKIRLEFSYGARPQVGKGTLIYLPITKDRDSFGRDPSKWDARVVRVDANQLSVQINLPANIAIGVWRFRVSTKLAGSRTIRTYSVKEALYIIFNAWSKDDAVYLSREDARQEYVLNDVGKIYIGSHAKPRGRKWIYGQFQESVLPAVIFMLDKTRLDVVGRANVVKVARAVSAMVNSHDDNGLLVGNWSGNYGDGLAPWQWTGSATILEKYLQSGGEPVKFGQCWVFAGVTTTALRTLGIPARTVSNFVSAHDTDDSLTVDKFFSEKGDPISDVNSDSIWNFHVWSDAWMARTDLPPGYGGWQAVDATPQETSMGMYQMGPASLEAIKKGEVSFAYDAAFVFAEVNADIVHWQQDDKSELQWKKIKTLKFHIGRKIFTKMIGQLDDYTSNGVNDAEDIISQYKNKEGTEDERMSVLNAARCGGLGFLFEQPAPGKEDVEFELFDIDKVALGDPFLVTVRIMNKSPMRRTISLALSASSVYYTGILAQKVKRDRQNVVLNGLQEQLVRVRVNPEDYMERLVDYSMMKIYAIATVKETQQTWSKEDDFMIEKPLAS